MHLGKHKALGARWLLVAAALVFGGCDDAGSAAAAAPAAPTKVVDEPTIRLTPRVSRNQDHYPLPPEQIAGPYYVVNNTWGTGRLPPGWSQQVGLSELQADGSVSCRFSWDFPQTVPGQDVFAYPECIYGMSIPGMGRAPAAELPKTLAALKGLRTSVRGINGAAQGMGHISYDLWLTTSDTEMIKSRLTEIMLPVHVIGGYGIPDWPEQAKAGREKQIVKGKSGRNPKGYKGRETVGGKAYDIYYDPPTQLKTRPDGSTVLLNSQGQAWTFIVFEPVEFAGTAAHTLDWMPLFEFLLGKGWIDRKAYLPGVELGYEPFGAGASGELTVVGFKVEVK